MWISSVFALVCYVLLASEAKPPDSLRMVHYIFRHGERTPDGTYKGDPNPPSTWPKGYYQLTPHGIQQQYELGKYFRKRYDGFISEFFLPNETRIRSTYKERCLMSASAHLAGLYPPKGEDLWNKDIQWQPVPVFTRPLFMDHELYPNDECPVKFDLLNAYYKSDEFRELSRQYDHFFAWISEKVDQEVNIGNVYYISDILRIEKRWGLPLPDFVNDTVIQTLEKLYNLGVKAFAGTEQLKRLSGGGGPFIKDITERMSLKITGKLDPDYKLYIYSDHDVSLVTFLVSLGMYDNIPPDYCATIIIELHEIKNQHYLKILYKNDTERDPVEMKIAECNVLCPFDKFVDLTKDIIPDDIGKECYYDNMNPKLLVLAVLVGVLFTFVLVQCCVIMLMYRKRGQFSFDRLT